MYPLFPKMKSKQTHEKTTLKFCIYLFICYSFLKHTLHLFNFSITNEFGLKTLPLSALLYLLQTTLFRHTNFTLNLAVTVHRFYTFQKLVFPYFNISETLQSQLKVVDHHFVRIQDKIFLDSLRHLLQHKPAREGFGGAAPYLLLQGGGTHGDSSTDTCGYAL